MGECNYYLKAEFPTKTAMKKAKPFIENLTKESYDAYDYWQKNREKDKNARTQFWTEFSAQFPAMTEYLKGAGLYGKDCSNGLSGKMDFGNRDENTLFEMTDEGNVLGYVGVDTWHFTDWTHFTEFIRTKCGATKVVWGTEENGVASLESLNLYEWQDIVKAIMKEKAILPTLLGIHNDLDVLIEQKMKKTKG